MTLRITEDEDEIGGHALIDLGQRAASPLLSFRRQDTEPRHLGTEGWQPEIAWLAPLSMTEHDGRTVARFGPSVVDRIEELVPIEIVGQDGTSFGVVSWPFITPAPAGSGMLAASPIPAPSLTQTAPSQETLAGEPGDGLAPLQDLETSPAEPEPPRRASVRDGLVLPEVPREAPRRIWPALVFLVLFAGAGIGTYLYQDLLKAVLAGHPTAPADTPAQPEARTPPAAEAPRLSAAELRQRHGRLLDERATGSAFLALGGTAIEAQQGGAAFRAFEEADPAASADAAWQMARFYDPRTTDTTYRDAAQPDVSRAAYYYALWRNRSPRHTDALRSLCDANTELVGRDERLRAICLP
ncbi:hypothetical protein E4V01_21475 [Methylorubrum sp. Q1]|uniref:hypothetical protein n=1 Tax=Methylorubrum sp. Q1 TaxID=2562453 RepID=UPI0010760B6C|nr:hypothetical protein [Methylorubrum sp. Q1]TFZ55759.1 hypothetical protein E4V01_21475 [Methylorubrum sp. Q1]